MKTQLSISSTLDHDGDGVVRYHLSADSREFRGTVFAWGSESDAADLAKLISGFPMSPESVIEFGFGSPKTGCCTLRFQTVDRRGNCCVWAEFEASYERSGTGHFETAAVCVSFLPAALDEFCVQLQRFKRGKQNEAVLGGMSERADR